MVSPMFNNVKFVSPSTVEAPSMVKQILPILLGIHGIPAED